MTATIQITVDIQLLDTSSDDPTATLHDPDPADMLYAQMLNAVPAILRTTLNTDSDDGITCTLGANHAVLRSVVRIMDVE